MLDCWFLRLLRLRTAAERVIRVCPTRKQKAYKSDERSKQQVNAAKEGSALNKGGIGILRLTVRKGGGCRESVMNGQWPCGVSCFSLFLFVLWEAGGYDLCVICVRSVRPSKVK